MIPFYEAHLHSKNKLYPCIKQKVAHYFYIVALLVVTIYEILKWLFDFHMNLSWPFCIWLLLVLITYACLYCTVFRCYGITLWGTIDFDRYAEYIAKSYWKNIQYDIEHGLLKNMLAEAKKDKESNILPEIIKEITQNAQNKYQKKYVIDCIFNICDNDNISSYINEYLISMAQSDDAVMHFLIEKTHSWITNHRALKNISLYLHLLKKLDKDKNNEEIIIRDLVNFIGCDEEYIKKYNELKDERDYKFLDTYQKIRIKNYVDAETKTAKDINDYNKKDKMFFDPLSYPVINEKGSQND